MWVLPGADNDTESKILGINELPLSVPSRGPCRTDDASTKQLRPVPAQALAYALASLSRTSLSAFTALKYRATRRFRYRNRRFQ